ncbi:MAG: hypothetical protein F4069_02930 [Rhodothermaceae bacterium]|nr:hypothetical protein [Rhodothermaceae bacterium]MYG70769.1 hypothetical protein [Rhodothermaceae bacterium]MYJ44275.1 hypothetical protein [Rhodothermaceae bacterium]
MKKSEHRYCQSRFSPRTAEMDLKNVLLQTRPVHRLKFQHMDLLLRLNPGNQVTDLSRVIRWLTRPGLAAQEWDE